MDVVPLLPLLPNSYKKIGIFDSGLGGLTVLKELYRSNVAQQYIYVGDTAHLPYGEKSTVQLQQRARIIAQYLIYQHVEICIIACHTLSSVSHTYLQEQFPGMVFIGMTDSVTRYALQQSFSKRIGILATTATIASHSHRNSLLQHEPNCIVIEQACPRLVPLIENVNHNVEELYGALHEYISPLLAQNVDTIILGCTHYALLKPMIKKLAGDAITIVSIEDIIVSKNSSKLESNSSLLECFVTGNSQSFQEKTSALLNWNFPVYTLDL